MATTEETSGQSTPATVRTGTVDVDLAVIAALRAYVLAADEYAEAKKRMETARAALDDAAGDRAEITHASQTAFRFKPYQRRNADLDRLALRHPDVYADVVSETTSYRLDINADYRRRLRLRTWRAAVRRKDA
jgi:hypothetical protein